MGPEIKSCALRMFVEAMPEHPPRIGAARNVGGLLATITETLRSVGLDIAMMDCFWSSIKIELLNRKKWKTRVELANAIFDCIESFHNRQRRHSALGYRTPIEYETLNENINLTAS